MEDSIHSVVCADDADESDDSLREVQVLPGTTQVLGVIHDSSPVLVRTN